MLAQPQMEMAPILTERKSAWPLKIMNLYDFDGVLGDSLEEALFQMPATKYDSEFVARVALDHNMDLSQESATSARYICIQAVLWMHDIPIKPGSITPDYNHPYYILTARSDRFAVARMHDYLWNFQVKPIKTQHLDHLPKGQAISVLLERHPDTHFRFFDDNPRHVMSARMLRSDRLEVFHVDNRLEDVYAGAESFYRNTILELSL